MTDGLESRIARLLAQILRVPPERVHPGSSLVGDLGAKSIDIIEVILALEEEFQADLPEFDITPEPFDLAPDMTVRDLAVLLRRCGAATGADASVSPAPARD